MLQRMEQDSTYRWRKEVRDIRIVKQNLENAEKNG